jgi:hypothetical protein
MMNDEVVLAARGGFTSTFIIHTSAFKSFPGVLPARG